MHTHRKPSAPIARTPCPFAWLAPRALEFMPFLAEYKWFRRWHGGHWEQWYEDVPITDTAWFHVRKCSIGTVLLTRPSTLCRGTPTCEDHPL